MKIYSIDFLAILILITLIDLFDIILNYFHNYWTSFFDLVETSIEELA